jgi:CRISPR-associated protein Cas1
MKKLLNSIYILDENTWLYLDGENIVGKNQERETLRRPLSNIEDIYCFNYIGCSPALMGKCMEMGKTINFFLPNGDYQASVRGKTKGNVFVRKAQFEKFANPPVILMQNTVASKLSNTRYLIKRSIRDNPHTNEDGELTKCVEYLETGIERTYQCTDREVLMGIEGNCAKAYFGIFNRLILQQKDDFHMSFRTKRPPLDNVNAVLSYMYTIMTNMYACALESVGLDSYYGFYHTLRSGRSSLACDLVEETRSIIERFVLTMINTKKITAEDFETQESSATMLTVDGKKKVLAEWNKKKRTDIQHMYLNEKVPVGLIPFIQSSLLAKYIREEIDEYPCFLLK